MLLDLGKFVSLTVSLLCIYAVFHTAFLVPAEALDQRIFASLKMLALAAAVCWGSGWIFCWSERKAGVENPRLVRTLPVQTFCWSLMVIFVLFLASWYFEVYFLPLRY